MTRTQFSAAERALRSRLAQLIHEAPLLRGTLSDRQVTCGKSGCRCAEGDKHAALCLSSSREGKTRQVFIPAALEAEVRQWVANYHRVRDLLEDLSELALQKVQARKRERKKEAP
jgi:hypothetical protein